jgi:hypothetical protein
MVAPVAFVGRERELSRLLAALAGDARLVLVVGDAGVGKTRFAGEGMARAAAAGTVAVRGECLPLTETLPLLPVAAAVSELARMDGGRLMEAGLAAAAWQDLGCPHRAGYAWWRQAQAQLDAGQPGPVAASALRAAAAAADGHTPLLDQIRLLAERARIPLQAPSAGISKTPPPAAGPVRYGLTRRELAVLRLLAAGRASVARAAGRGPTTVTGGRAPGPGPRWRRGRTGSRPGLWRPAAAPRTR